MLTAASILFVLFCLSAGLQLSWGRRFLGVSKLEDHIKLDDDQLPKVLVLLSLRGADPFLSDCILALLRQNYPRYDVQIVVDHPSDDAWQIAEDSIRAASAEHAEVVALRPPLGTCGLRVNALLQQIEELDEAYEVVAWLDADTIPYPNWLRDMVVPFSDPSVGATTGIRWYVPSYNNLGTLIRSAWNAAGAVQMVAFGMAFGGSLAYRASLLRQPELQATWRQVLWEDIATLRTVQQYGHRLAFVNAATMATRERISLVSCMRFMARQMLNVRLYHWAWPVIVVYCLFTALAPLMAIGLCIGGMIHDQTPVVLMAVAGLLTNVVAALYSVLTSGFFARRCVTDRGEPPWTAPWGMFPAVLLTPFVYGISVVAALVTNQVTWRGIRYKVRGPFEIELVEYRPFSRPAKASNDQAESL